MRMKKRHILDKLAVEGTVVQSKSTRNEAEHAIVSEIDNKRHLARYKKNLSKLQNGSLDVPGFLREISAEMLKNLLLISQTTKSEKVVVGIAQDLLDRAGHGKINKAIVAHSNIDHNTTKKELVNAVLSLGKQSGIKIIDDKHVEGDEDILDGDYE